MTKPQKLVCFVMLVAIPWLAGVSPMGCGGSNELESSTNQMSREEEYVNPNTGGIAFTLDWSHPDEQAESGNTITDESILDEENVNQDAETGSITIHWNSY